MKAGREGGGRRGTQTQNRVTEGERGREERGLEQGKGKRRSREKLRNMKKKIKAATSRHVTLPSSLKEKRFHSSHVVLVLEEEFRSERKRGGGGRGRTERSRKSKRGERMEREKGGMMEKERGPPVVRHLPHPSARSQPNQSVNS